MMRMQRLPARIPNADVLQHMQSNLCGTITLVQSRWCNPCGATDEVRNANQHMAAQSNTKQCKAMKEDANQC
eukprot:8393468-Pyramimonas_sp.AAC.1